MVTKEEQEIYDNQHPLLKECDEKIGAKFIGIKDGFICCKLPDIVITKEEVSKHDHFLE